MAVLRDSNKRWQAKAMPNTEPVRVTIFNQTYSLVASEEPGRIEQLAQRVDDLMSAIAVRAGNVDATRAAVLACLHLADELEFAGAAAGESEGQSGSQGPSVHVVAGRSHTASDSGRNIRAHARLT